MKISIIIPSYNRFNYLLNALNSIKSQSLYDHALGIKIILEIIIINDCSTQNEYYTHDFGSDIRLINLNTNSKKIFGNSAIGYVRNKGLEIATGEYIAFLDDDDIMLPFKLLILTKFAVENNASFICSDGLIGEGVYLPNKLYKKYNEEEFKEAITVVHKINNSNLMDNGFPSIWTHEFISIHNSIITSSVFMSKSLVDKVGWFNLNNFAEDWDYWLRASKLSNINYLNTPLFYYDNNHGNGSLYK